MSPTSGLDGDTSVSRYFLIAFVMLLPLFVAPSAAVADRVSCQAQCKVKRNNCFRRADVYAKTACEDQFDSCYYDWCNGK
jgi:hypothetical protein